MLITMENMAPIFYALRTVSMCRMLSVACGLVCFVVQYRLENISSFHILSSFAIVFNEIL